MPADFAGFQLRPTRWGALFVVAVLVLAVAALNTANNALIAVLAAALGSYAVAGTWSRQVLGSVTAVVHPVGEIYAGRSARLEVRLSNRSRWFTAYGVAVRDEEGTLLAVAPVLAPAAECLLTVSHRFERRGWQPVGPWRLAVVLPLGFFVKSKRCAAEQRVLVLPRLLERGGARERRVPGRPSAADQRDRGREGEVTQLRGFREGDDVRQLHWKQTARQQQPIVVERQRPDDEPVQLVLDPRVAQLDDARVRARFERLVSEVATTAVRRLDSGRAVGLVVGSRSLPPARGHRHGLRLLRLLAEVEPVAIDDRGPAADLAETA